jgi:hypothetical protein
MKMSSEEGTASDDTKMEEVFVPEGKKDCPHGVQTGFVGICQLGFSWICRRISTHFTNSYQHFTSILPAFSIHT